MEKGRGSYKIISFLNAFTAFRMENHIGSRNANTFEITCYIQTTKNFVTFSELEDAVNNVVRSLTDKDLNTLPKFADKDFSVEMLTEYLAVMINNELFVNGNRLVKIEVAQSPTRIFCLDFE